ncbi:MAG: TonB-dependent receptor [Hydrocarboniphaga sp.]|uniref:TonB-dependent receptor n=1 Tax=Hydrocarboniphaga sp. TaxID=2033016 RepID=UPI002627631C|nr:TonB-dependent receptor [Hydrocarboniphaga sp.]MDB5970003.1 TonB-dependent receptor [Hydrocarboniphaga sp.]
MSLSVFRAFALVLPLSWSVVASAQEAPVAQGSTPDGQAAGAPELSSIPVDTPAETPVEAEARDSSEPGGLEEIVVTAQHRVESAQKAAVALDVVSGDDLEKSGIVDLTRLNEKMPALVSNGISNFVRGVGTFSQLGYTDPAVAFNYDGVYIGRSTSTQGLFFDLQRIELLKGPQGTLYGRNATGGALNVLPVEPQLGQTSGYFNVGYGNYAFYNAEGAFNEPIGEDSAIRLSALVTANDGFANDGTGDKNIKSVRLQEKSQLSDDVTLRLSGDYSHAGGVGGSSTYLDYSQYDSRAGAYTATPTHFSPSEGLFSTKLQDYRTTLFIPQVGRNYDHLSPYPLSDSDYYGTNAELDWTTNAGVVTFIPAYRGYHSNVIVGTPFSLGSVDTGNQFSVETRLASAGGELLDYTTGMYFYHEAVSSDGAINQSAVYARQFYDSDSSSAAAFARLTFHVTDDLRVVGGARYTRDWKKFDGNTDGLAMVCINKIIGIPNCPNARLFIYAPKPEDQPFNIPTAGGLPTVQLPEETIIIRQITSEQAKLNQGRPTFRGALEYDLEPESLLYASVENGFRSGGFSIAAGYESYRPEKIIAYTVGSKNRFWNGNFELNAEAFDWEYKDQQLGYLGEDTNGNLNFIIQNIGSSSIRGFELDAKALPWPGMHAGATLQYLDSTYNAFQYDTPIVDVIPIITTDNSPPQLVGCPSTKNAGGDSYHVNCDGYPGFNSPKWTLNLSLSQAIPVSDYIVLLSAETQYRTSYYVGFQYLPFQQQGDAWRSQAQIVLTPKNATYVWSVSAYIRNIENTRSLTSTASQSGIDSASYSDPRTYGVRLSVQF